MCACVGISNWVIVKTHLGLHIQFRFFFPWWARVSSLSRLHDYTQTHLLTSEQPDAETSTFLRTTFTTDNHAPGVFRTRHHSERAAAVPHLRRRGHWDRYSVCYCRQILDKISLGRQIFVVEIVQISLNCVHLSWNYFMCLVGQRDWCGAPPGCSPWPRRNQDCRFILHTPTDLVLNIFWHGPEHCSLYSYSLRAGRSWDQILIGAISYRIVQTAPGVHPPAVRWAQHLFPGSKVAGLWS